MAAPTSLIAHAVYEQLLKLERARLEENNPISFQSIQEGALNMQEAHYAWERALRDGKKLPHTAARAAIRVAAVAEKFASDLMALHEARLLQAELQSTDE